MIPCLDWFAARAGPIFCGDVFVVVFTQERVSCSTLDEAAIGVAGGKGEVFVGFKGRGESVGLEESAWLLELSVPRCCPGVNKELAGLGFFVGEGDGWVFYCDLCGCFRQGVRSFVSDDLFVTRRPCDFDMVTG